MTGPPVALKVCLWWAAQTQSLPARRSQFPLAAQPAIPICPDLALWIGVYSQLHCLAARPQTTASVLDGCLHPHAGFGSAPEWTPSPLIQYLADVDHPDRDRHPGDLPVVPFALSAAARCVPTVGATGEDRRLYRRAYGLFGRCSVVGHAFRYESSRGSDCRCRTYRLHPSPGTGSDTARHLRHPQTPTARFGALAGGHLCPVERYLVLIRQHRRSGCPLHSLDDWTEHEGAALRLMG